MMYDDHVVAKAVICSAAIRALEITHGSSGWFVEKVFVGSDENSFNGADWWDMNERQRKDMIGHVQNAGADYTPEELHYAFLRLYSNWSHGPYDLLKKTHPLVREWEELSDAQREAYKLIARIAY